MRHGVDIKAVGSCRVIMGDQPNRKLSLCIRLVVKVLCAAVRIPILVNLLSVDKWLVGDFDDQHISTGQVRIDGGERREMRGEVQFGWGGGWWKLSTSQEQVRYRRLLQWRIDD